jgi:hypothetical protein
MRLTLRHLCAASCKNLVGPTGHPGAGENETKRAFDCLLYRAAQMGISPQLSEPTVRRLDGLELPAPSTHFSADRSLEPKVCRSWIEFSNGLSQRT